MSKTSKAEETEVVVGSIEWRESLYGLRNTKAWQKELLKLLDKDELIEEYPSTDGLARLCRIVFGDFSTNVDVKKCPNSDDRSATVIVNVYVYSPIFGELNHGGAADVSPNNTKLPFSAHPVATAETKALGRALYSVCPSGRP